MNQSPALTIVQPFLVSGVSLARTIDFSRQFRCHTRLYCPLQKIRTEDGGWKEVKTVAKRYEPPILLDFDYSLLPKDLSEMDSYKCKVPDCLSQPCLRGGTCKETDTGFVCNCLANFTGIRCDDDLNECLQTGSSYPCDPINGLCINFHGSYSCSCVAGYLMETGGNLCADNDECAETGSLHPCDSTNGVCTNTDGSYTCDCQPGFEFGSDPDSTECFAYDPDCFTDPQGLDYRGNLDHTSTGITCQNWLSTSPHDGLLNNFPGVGNNNYCRNPDGDLMPWCYTMDPSVRWYYCDIGTASDFCASQ
ncbi:tissue-type plasminogen activator-like [Diadema antillarum]|uniref:tissue-type plasminogen activator-like n=1 Tax=Diadema antillarum TaxID=105358 RepID=UPI003A87D77B